MTPIVLYLLSVLGLTSSLQMGLHLPTNEPCPICQSGMLHIIRVKGLGIKKVCVLHVPYAPESGMGKHAYKNAPGCGYVSKQTYTTIQPLEG